MKTHIFEKAGLGKAPYKYSHYQKLEYQAAPGAPIQAGGSCDYCAMAIKNAFYFKSADGKTFKVGSTCVDKSGDRGMKAAVRKIQKKANASRDKERIQAGVRALLQAEVRRALRSKPHSYQWLADKGLTKLHEVSYLLRNGGNSGKIRAVRAMNKECGLKL